MTTNLLKIIKDIGYLSFYESLKGSITINWMARFVYWSRIMQIGIVEAMEAMGKVVLKISLSQLRDMFLDMKKFHSLMGYNKKP